MTKKQIDSWEELFEEWNNEARTYESLIKLREWYMKRSTEIWEPYQVEIQRLIKKGIALTSKVRDKVAEDTGAALLSSRLLKFYDSKVKELMDKSAIKLLDPDSADFREVILKYDKAWQELAKK
ncbi:MAG: hypothetical protein HY769_01565 [Candidatus Stahlbacteria bacterium]|nr:hypothetical protein [Candidatus Stahlbacteria bacterium]